MVWETICPPFFLGYFPLFYTSLSLLLCVHVYVSLFRSGTCPFSPYPKWLGLVVKAEEHGPVRHRVLNYSIGSLLRGPLLHCACPFFLGALQDAEDKIVLSYIPRPFGLSLNVLGNASPRLGPWALM